MRKLIITATIAGCIGIGIGPAAPAAATSVELTSTASGPVPVVTRPGLALAVSGGRFVPGVEHEVEYELLAAT